VGKMGFVRNDGVDPQTISRLLHRFASDHYFSFSPLSGSFFETFDDTTPLRGIAEREGKKKKILW
jgi:hypothetical protein